MKTKFYFSKILIAPFIFFPEILFGQWATNPSVNNPICKTVGDQEFPKIAKDLNGGAFICWRDFRSGTTTDILAQKVTGSATIAWAPNGVIVCDAPGDQYEPIVISDELGGSIYAWTDSRGGSNHSGLYMQKLHSNGQRLWQDEGVMITSDSVVGGSMKMIADGLGGAYIVWEDIRVQSGIMGDIYAQHINSAGVQLWGSRGIPICKLNADQQTPSIVPDGNGGAYICWEDDRGSLNLDIYAQRINADGIIQWPLNGIRISYMDDSDQNAVLSATENGEAIIVWGHGSSSNIYAQRVNKSGELLWNGTDGIRIDGSSAYNYKLSITSDNNDGAYIAWESLATQVSVQHITKEGNLFSSPIFVTTEWYNQHNPKIVTDGTNGAIVVWEDTRKEFTSFNTSIYAQKINIDGNILWNSDGEPISLASISTQDFDPKEFVEAVGTGNGDVIVSWSDLRNNENNQEDVYAQLIGLGGINPVELSASLKSIPEIISNLIIYPNPSSINAMISFELKENTPLSISIINNSGQIIDYQKYQEFTTGKNQLNFKTSHLSSGMYTIVLETNLGKTYHKFNVQ